VRWLLPLLITIRSIARPSSRLLHSMRCDCHACSKVSFKGTSMDAVEAVSLLISASMRPSSASAFCLALASSGRVRRPVA
jgi:hypothetical protein